MLNLSKIMDRNAVQISMTNGKVVVQITGRPELVSISPLKSSFREKQETKNVKRNMPTSTPLLYLNLESRNILIVLHTKIPKLNEKKKN